VDTSHVKCKLSDVLGHPAKVSEETNMCGWFPIPCSMRPSLYLARFPQTYGGHDLYRLRVM